MSKSIPKGVLSQIQKNMEQHYTSYINRELEKSYQILLGVIFLLEQYQCKVEKDTFDRFYFLLRGDVQKDKNLSIIASEYEFPVNFLSIEPKGDNMVQTDDRLIEYTYTKSGLMNSDDHAIITQYLIVELDKVVPSLQKVVFEIIYGGSSL